MGLSKSKKGYMVWHLQTFLGKSKTQHLLDWPRARERERELEVRFCPIQRHQRRGRGRKKRRSSQQAEHPSPLAILLVSYMALVTQRLSTYGIVINVTAGQNTCLKYLCKQIAKQHNFVERCFSCATRKRPTTVHSMSVLCISMALHLGFPFGHEALTPAGLLFPPRKVVTWLQIHFYGFCLHLKWTEWARTRCCCAPINYFYGPFKYEA